MPYTRRRRAPVKRRRYARKNTYVRKVARAEAKKVVARAVETKVYDYSASAQAIDYTNGLVVSATTTMTRGTAENQYIADKIHPVGVRLSMQYTRADATQMLRLIIIQNKGGGVPLLNTLLAATGNITAPLSPYDLNYNDTYRVLYDKLVSMDSIRGTTMTSIVKIPAKKLRQLTFNDGAGTVEAGGIYFCWISDSAVAAHPTVDYRFRFYYKDA